MHAVSERSASSGPRLRPWLFLAVATVPAILSVFETLVFMRIANRPMPLWRAFVAEAPQWYGWALLAPAIMAIGRRFPLTRPLRWRNIAVHAMASLGCGVVVAAATAGVNWFVRPSAAGVLASARNWFLSQLPAATIVYFSIVGVSYAIASSIELRKRQQEAAELEARLRDAQLSALRMQLQPHFLFNSLNAIMALVRDQETTRAVRAISLLSDVLRATVNVANEHETTLAGEIDFVTRYLEIERVRFGDRLRVTIDVPDELRGALVPTFVLQPFVENALKHGILRDRGGNEITLRARATNGSLELTVSDDGRGMPADANEPRGVGISNARARLERLYGTNGRLTVNTSAGGRGVVVEIGLPLRRPEVATA